MNQSLLIIDDSPAIHALLRARLKDESIALHFATSGEQGIAMASTILPDAILLDVEMPGLDGFEVCRRLKAVPDLSSIPVIFMTGATSTDHKLRGLELGAVDYITKPFDPAELRARVRAALRMKFMMDLLAQKAQIDPLTGLWNRRYFQQRFEAELSLARRASRPLAVLILELNDFKSINDSFGRPRGDEVLREIGQLLAQSIRVEDIVCRWSGDEFAIIAPNISTGAAELAQRLRVMIESTRLIVARQELSVKVSIGVAAAEQPDHSLLDQAMAALKCAEQTSLIPSPSGRRLA